jgi:hypothetical protein
VHHLLLLTGYPSRLTRRSPLLLPGLLLLLLLGCKHLGHRLRILSHLLRSVAVT